MNAFDALATAPRRRQLLAGAAWLTGGLVLSWPAGAQAATRRETRWLFGSPCEVLVSGDVAPALAWQLLASINERWNAWKPGGLAGLNRALREGRTVRVDAPLRQVLQRAARLETASGGLFNPAIGALVRDWGFHADQLLPGPAPSAAQRARWLHRRPSLAQLVWQGERVHSDNPLLQIDLGAYAKGVAADLALDRLLAAGAQGAVVNLGGNLAAGGLVGGPTGGRAWQVGIRDPLARDGSGLMAGLATQGREAVITSGVYERQRPVDGRWLSHLIDPATGAPAQGLLSTTVVHRDAALADAAATALLVAGARRWPAVAASLGVDQVLVVHDNGRAQVTPRLAARLQRQPGWAGTWQPVT